MLIVSSMENVEKCEAKETKLYYFPESIMEVGIWHSA